MKNVRIKWSAFLILIIIFSCTKDYELENSTVNGQKYFVELSQAKKIAEDILFETKTNVSSSKGISINPSKKTIKKIKEVKNDKGEISFYIINYNERGFVLLSDDKRTNPILGYSEDGNFDTDENSYPLGLKYWIEDTKKQITDIKFSNIEQSRINKIAWENVQNLIASLGKSLFAKEPSEECYEHTETIYV